ncbi:hypothetical protein PQX77_011009 [Marasmius sp. AFHP31]|nr:hypothetical protein PQX77_011009 [Marasmius sp. AFHP31]
MPLFKQDSIVADSTATSSPSRAITPIKRPTKTYGRGPSTLDAEHHRSSSSSSASGYSTGSIYRTGPPNSREEVPPSSEPANSSPSQRLRQVEEDDDDGSSSQNASPKHNFGWAQRLKDIDAEFDEKDPGAGENEGQSSVAGSSQVAVLEQVVEQRKSEATSSSLAPSKPLSSLKDDPFNESLSTLTSSSQAASHPDSGPNSPQVTNRKRVSRRVIDDEESGGEQGPEESSPAKPFPISSPRAPSPTPPTSDEDMPITKSNKKGKGKASSTRDSVPPLQFEEELSAKPGGSETKPQRKQRKPRPPTKKEQQEMYKERSRINASRAAHIPHHESARDRSTKAFLASLSLPQPPPQSSPIQQFSSPCGHRPAEASTSSRVAFDLDLPPLDDSDDEAPELASALKTAKDHKSAAFEETKQRLAEQKQRALNQMTVKHPVDDDDELEIVPTVLSSKGRSVIARGGKPLQPRSAPTSTRKPNPAKREPSIPVRKETNRPLDPKAVKEIEFKKVRASESVARQMKQEKWLRNGGTLAETKQEAEGSLSLQALLKRGLERRDNYKGDQDPADDDEDDGSDGEWNPEVEAQLRGSATPEPEGEEEGGEEENFDGEMDVDSQDVTMVDTADHEVTLESSQEEPLKLKRTRRNNILVDSDSEGENDENAAPASLSTTRVEGFEDEDAATGHRRGSVSSLDGATEDENDKENDTRRMYDRSEDKENTAVVRHSTGPSRPLLGSRQSSLRGREVLSTPLSMSPGNQRQGSDEENDENVLSQRKPLQPLPSSESLLASPTAFLNRVRQAQPDPLSTPTGDEGTSGLEPALNIIGPRPNAGFSQFSDDESENATSKPLEGGFADLFESGTQVSPHRTLVAPRRAPAALGLTQDVEGQPMLAVDEKLKRQADDIFEKEQGWVIERADQGIDKQPELYINDAGFLTQTRPEGTPDIYRPMPTQTQQSLSRQTSQVLFSQRRALSEVSLTPTASTQRTPFRDISLTESDFDMPDATLQDSPSNNGRLRRLKKRDGSPSKDEGQMLPPPLTLSESFQLKPKKVRPPKEKRPLAKSEFVEGEAEESDEERTFGFIKTKDGDDEEDDEEEAQDKSLATLVDDKEMNEDEVNQEAVMEKYKEHEQEDDKKLEELHQRAAGGELRTKRKYRTMLDDSDEEEGEDGHNARARRRMAKGGDISRDNIKQMGEDPQTRAFYESYAKTIRDDDDDSGLGYLQTPDVTMGDATVVAEGDEDEEEGGDDRYVDKKQLDDELRQAAQNKQGEEMSQFDPLDLTWTERDEDEPKVKVKAFSGPKVTDRRAANHRDEQIELDSESQRSSFLDTDANRSRSEKWAVGENRSRARGGNGMSKGASVTGLRGRPIAEGKGSLRRGTASGLKDSGAATSRSTKPLKAAQSMLKRTEQDRSTRFGQ